MTKYKYTAGFIGLLLAASVYAQTQVGTNTIEDAAVTEAKLSSSVNTSLDLADSALQSFTEVDGSTTNELQALAISSNSLSLSNSGVHIDLSPYLDNTQLTNSQVAAAAISEGFVTGAHTVDPVTKVGVPVDGQVGVWTGDGTLQGTSLLTRDVYGLLISQFRDPALRLQSTEQGEIWKVWTDWGADDFHITHETGARTPFTIEQTAVDNLINIGLAADTNAVEINGSLEVVGNIDVTTTVDGRDISVDGATLDSHITHPLVEAAVPTGAVFTDTQLSDVQVDTAASNQGYVKGAHTIDTDTIYDDTTIQAAVTLNTAKVTDLVHPLVETAVPVGALFTDADTVYDDTSIQAAVGLNTAKVTDLVHPLVETAVPVGALFTDTNTQLSDAQVNTAATNEGFVVGAHTTDTDTQLDLAGVQALGFVTGSHTVDTDTQLDLAGVQALGFITGAHTVDTDTDTQLDLSGVQALGFVTGAHTVDTDTNTQLDLAGVQALGFVAGAHTVDTDTDTQLSDAQVATAAVNGGFVTGAHTTDTNTTYVSSDFDHDATTNFAAGEHFTQAQISITESQISDLTGGHSDGANCAAGNYPLGVDGDGAVQGCTTAGGGQLSALSDVNTSTATNRNVLVADGTDWESRPLVSADISDASGALVATSAYLTSNLAVASGVQTAVVGFTELYDVGTDFNPTTGVFTAPIAGRYNIAFTAMFAVSAASDRLATAIKVGSVTVASSSLEVGYALSQLVPPAITTVELAVGDAVTFWATNANNSDSVTSGRANTYLSIDYLGTGVLAGNLAAVSQAEAEAGIVTDIRSWSPLRVKQAAPVASVNTQTGVVVLDADDVSDAATTNKYTTAAEISKLSGIEVGATADQTSVTGNAGTATLAANSSLLGGLASSYAATGSTVPLRDAAGDIRARLFRSEYAGTNATINYVMTQRDPASDNYLRPSTIAQLKTSLRASGQDTWHYVGGSGEITFQYSWVNYNSNSGTYQTARFTKIDGIVYVEGLVKNGSSATSIILVLPPGYRPAKRLMTSTFSAGGATRIDVQSTGAMLMSTGASTTWASITMSFPVDL